MSEGKPVIARNAGRAAGRWAQAVLVALLGAAVAGMISGAAPAAAPKLTGAEACLDCHEVGPAQPRKSGVAPHIDASIRAGAHAAVACVDCHADLKKGDFPHPEKLAPVVCASCHRDQAAQYARSLHGRASQRGDRLAPNCRTCHGGTHGIRRHTDPASPTTVMNIPFLCGRCHHEGSPVQLTHTIPQDSVLENYSESIHGQGLFKKGLVVTAVCTSCHTSHNILPHTDPASSISKGRIAATCEQCHAQIERVHRKVIRGELWEKQPHLVPACVDCHAPHKVRKVFYSQGMANDDCMRCHARSDLKSAKGIPAKDLLVNLGDLSHSRHAKVACVQCHTSGSPSLARPCQTMNGRVDCSICHAGQVEVYKTSTHGQLAARQSPDAPECRDCHGTHGIKGRLEPDSPTFSRNVPVLCGRCHSRGQRAALRRKDLGAMVTSYGESIHGKGLLAAGLTVTATCASCHTAHGEKPASDPTSTVNPANVAQTCAQCHRGIYEKYSASVHSALVTRTRLKLPTCNDCHSAHAIQRSDKANFQLSIMTQCGKCHQEIASRYFDTYHGKVTKLGYTKTAKCFDCHGAHDILPVWDPRSHLHRNNIVKTCAQCHPGSNRRFAGYLTHATHHDPRKYPFLFYTFWGMTLLLLGTFTVAGLHTLAWLPRSLQYRRTVAAQLHREGGEGHGQYVRRFSPFYNRLHLMVIVSFFTLALTGMTLKFSYTGWARVLARLFGGFEAAGVLHRIGAVITFAYFGLHLWDLLTRKRKEAGGLKNLVMGVNSMVPNLDDAREIVGSVKWFLGMGPRPKYGRWTYWEKVDYFAVFWGVSVIGLTGLLLWFPEFFTRFVPGWLLNVATIVHSDEALLAVGFIFTIHFFNTHFRPEKFPMDPVIFTGVVPLEELKIDRPREYEHLVRTGKLKEHLAAPPTERALRIWRIFGFTALGVGISLILLILYAALFKYR
jgi:cytochrome b subunit of formate dehydrogenase